MYLICLRHIQAYLLMNAMEFHVYYILNVFNVIFILYLIFHNVLYICSTKLLNSNCWWVLFYGGKTFKLLYCR